MNDAFVKIDTALEKLEQKIKAREERFRFEKGLLSAEMEKSLQKYAEMKEAGVKIAGRLDEVILQLETYKEN